MFWLAILGLIALAFVIAGCALTARRIRCYREETETRRARAFAEMMKIAERQKKEKAVTRDS